MRILKRGISAILAALMLSTTLAQAGAADDTSNSMQETSITQQTPAESGKDKGLTDNDSSVTKTVQAPADTKNNGENAEQAVPTQGADTGKKDASDVEQKAPTQDADTGKEDASDVEQKAPTQGVDAGNDTSDAEQVPPTQGTDAEKDSAEAEPETQPAEDSEDSDDAEFMAQYGENYTVELAEGEVAFNLQDTPITVGNNAEKADGSLPYFLFGEDGSFTIDLDELYPTPNVFFPFEVQFITPDGNKTEEWFMTPESTVEVDGHTFSMHSTKAGSDVLTQVGVYVGDTYVPAYPEEKTFTGMPQAETASLLDLKKVDLNLDLSKSGSPIIPIERKVKLSTVIGNSTSQSNPDEEIDAANKAVVWVAQHLNNFISDYHVIDPANVETSWIDFNFADSDHNYYKFYLELITGTADQLNPDNVRYKINVSLPYETDIKSYLEWKTGQPPYSINDVSVNTYYDKANFTIELNEYKNIPLGISLKEDNLKPTEENPTLKIFKSNWQSLSKMKDEFTPPENAEDVTKQFADTSYQYTYDDYDDTVFLIGIYRGDVCTGMLKSSIHIYSPSSSAYLYMKSAYYKHNDSWSWISKTSRTDRSDLDLGLLNIAIGNSMPVTTECAIHFDYSGKTIIHAVEGYYESAEDIRNHDDIKDKLFAPYSAEADDIYHSTFAEEKLFSILCSDEDIHHFGVIATSVSSAVSLPVSSFLYADTKKPATDLSSTNRIYLYLYVKEPALNNKYIITLKYGSDNLETYEYEYLTGNQALKKVKKAVVGKFDSLEEANGEEDIKEKLFADSPEDGYIVDLGEKKEGSFEFTVFGMDNKAHYESYDVKVPYSVDLAINGFSDDNGPLGCYEVSANDDSYYLNGYRTFLVLNSKNEAVADSELTMNYSEYDDRKVNVLVDGTSSDETSTPQKHNFLGEKPVQYTVIANNSNSKNYQISAKTQEQGPKLFVNGPQENRDVFMIDYYNNHHDIFIANIGDQELEGLEVKLTGEDGTGNATNVALDDYWTIRNDGTRKLAPFTSVQNSNYNWDNRKYLNNIAKIRLVPSKDSDGGAIKGLLTISAKDQTPVKIKLLGIASNPKIVSDGIPNGVKYVVYNGLLMQDNMYDWITPTFEIIKGKLPEGLTLDNSSGQIVGVPTETGKFTITVRANFELNKDFMDSDVSFKPDEKEMTFEILDNTDENVEGKLGIDKDYEIETRFEDFEEEEYEDRDFVSNGEFEEFEALYLDGKELTKGVDYTVDEGSTKMTLLKKTTQSKGTGRHTLSAKFVKSNTNNRQVRRTSQNYTSKPKTSSGSSSPSRPSSGGSSGRPSSGNAPSYSRPTTTYTPPATIIPTQTTPVTPEQPSKPQPHTVTAPKPQNGTVSVDPPNAEAGATVTITLKPDDGYKINTITITDVKGNPVSIVDIGNGKYTFIMPDTDVSITTKYTEINPVFSADEQDERVPFHDIKKGSWFADSIAYVYEKGLMKGVTEEAFEPNSPSSRAMIVTILYRMEGEPEVSGSAFPDVADNEWYSSAATWAKQNNIFTGYSDGRFGTNDNVTREQIASVVMRYAEKRGIDTSNKADLSSFSDNAAISLYAKDAIAWCNQMGIILGKSNGSLKPRESATRAEIATILMRADKIISESKTDDASDDKPDDTSSNKSDASSDNKPNDTSNNSTSDDKSNS